MTRFQAIVVGKTAIVTIVFWVPLSALCSAVQLALRIRTGEAAAFAHRLVEREERSRSFSTFKASYKISQDLALETCPDLADMPSFIRSAQKSRLGLPVSLRHGSLSVVMILVLTALSFSVRTLGIHVVKVSSGKDHGIGTGIPS